MGTTVWLGPGGGGGGAVGPASGHAPSMIDSQIVIAPPPSLRHDWTVSEIESIYTAALPNLNFRAQSVHRVRHQPDEVQGCMLLSIKTGGCPEDCAYCPQSAHYKTGVARTELVPL